MNFYRKKYGKILKVKYAIGARDLIVNEDKTIDLLIPALKLFTNQALRVNKLIEYRAIETDADWRNISKLYKKAQ